MSRSLETQLLLQLAGASSRSLSTALPVALLPSASLLQSLAHHEPSVSWSPSPSAAPPATHHQQQQQQQHDGITSCSTKQHSAQQQHWDQPQHHPFWRVPAPGTSSSSAPAQPQYSARRVPSGWHSAGSLLPAMLGSCRGPTPASVAPQPAMTRGLRAATRAAPPRQDDEEFALLASELFKGGEVLTPTAIVQALDRYIVGQADAKRAVAVALRNRWRRSRLPRLAADEVMPKNILMVGPTGCGKTEIARRLAKLADAPFIKVEATKYTELGYVGKDVEDIIKDLVEASQALVRQRLRQRAHAAMADRVENVILNALCGEFSSPETRDSFRELYRTGQLDERMVEVELGGADPNEGPGPRRINLEGGGLAFIETVQGLPGGKMSMQSSREKARLKVSEAREKLLDTESERLLNSDEVTKEAVRAAEQDGIVFIDEIDKIVDSSVGRAVTGRGASSEGVQRDLLPIIEGSTVPTKYGNVSTNHVLFICSGAFHSAKPSDMLAELQGRLPIRVGLKALNAEDFYRILTEPTNNMLMQQKALLATEGVDLHFTEGAVRTMASVAEEVNRLLDNIGARRLHTVLERVLSELSYNAPELVAEARSKDQAVLRYTVDEEYVRRVMAELLAKKDLSRYIL